MAEEVPPGERGEGDDVVETGVAGLVLIRTGPDVQWRLVHAATGLLVSRSAVSYDRRALISLAQQLGPLGNWSGRELSMPGPALRQAVEAAAARCGLLLPAVTAASADTSPTTPPAGSPPSPESDIRLLQRVLRLVHRSLPPGVFASAIAELDGPQRARLRELILGEGVRDAVVKPIAQVRAPAPRPARRAPSKAPGSAPSSGSATG